MPAGWPEALHPSRQSHVQDESIVVRDGSKDNSAHSLLQCGTGLDRDHFGNPARPLRDRLALDGARHGIDLPDGRIFLLTHLRYLGYGFNPVSFFYCFDAAERLQIVLAEVSNTFGGAHNYWLRPDAASRSFRSVAPKALYVSPFMPVDLDYRFAFTPPAGS